MGPDRTNKKKFRGPNAYRQKSTWRVQRKLMRSPRVRLPLLGAKFQTS